MRQRWYDFDPVISLAVNLIGQADKSAKDYCLDYIIKKTEDAGIETEENLNERFDCIWQRRADETLHFLKAMEHFKKAEFDFQKELALYIIKYLQKTS